MLPYIGTVNGFLKKNSAILDLMFNLALLSALIYFGLKLQPQVIHLCDYQVNYSIFANLSGNVSFLNLTG